MGGITDVETHRDTHRGTRRKTHGIGARLTSLRNRASGLLAGGNRSTIDTIRMAPPPSPLAPVDLTDPLAVHLVTDVAIRIGDLLLSSGTGNSDTKAQILAITSAYGLYGCHVDITLNTITVYTRSTDHADPPIINFRVVSALSTDFSRLTEVDRLIRSIVNGATPVEQAVTIVTELERRPLPYRMRWVPPCWGLFAGFVALLLGGGPVVALISVFTTTIITAVNLYLSGKGLPLFFRNLIGGVIATVPAALTFSFARTLYIHLSPSIVIAACIIAMLAGLTLVQALQDGVTGAPVTASARFFETVLLTGGIIAGVAIGLQLMSRVGMSLPSLDTSASDFGGVGGVALRILGGVGAAAFFCLAEFCDRRALVVATFTTFVALVVHQLVMPLVGLDSVSAAGAVAVLIGLAGGLLSRRYLIPPQITAIAGITPLLPGLSLYRGMYSLLSDQLVVGLSSLGIALATATALAAGVTFGEWIARRLRAPRILHRDLGLRRPAVRRAPRHWKLRADRARRRRRR
ncbi:threonine/serine exporter ThrE [Corynebacterium terpenotabidum]|uniref:threonine/serine exporter ThrE n=1 Tax=Corynebacterium terpenotabidum TaxID=89154 RepID=UPI00040562B7|nr:threonine/serine exporter family protein [Corynebacterium terpenotabidum]